MTHHETQNDIWVFAEQRNGVLHGVSLELLGKARELAKQAGSSVGSILLGHQVSALAQTLISHGADRVYVVDDILLTHYRLIPFAAIVTRLIRQHDPGAVLMGATAMGVELAPRVAARLETGLSAHCVDLKLDEKGRLLQVVPGWGGGVIATIACPAHRPQMATVMPGAMQAMGSSEREGQVIACPAKKRHYGPVKNMAERVGFEPTVPLLGGTRDFQSRSFGQLGHLSAVSLTRNTLSYQLLANGQKPEILFLTRNPDSLESFLPRAISHRPRVKFSFAEFSGGEGGIRTHVPRYWQGKSISSRPRYDHFGTSPVSLLLHPPHPEELLHQLSAFLGQNSGDHLHAMVQSKVRRHIVQGACSPCFRIGRPKHQTGDPCMNGRPDTHQAGLDSHHQRGSLQAVILIENPCLPQD